MMRLILLLSAVTLAVAFKNPHFASGRTTMVHLFEWKWDDIAAECERFLGPRGFGGIQVKKIFIQLFLASRFTSSHTHIYRPGQEKNNVKNVSLSTYGLF